MFGVLAPKDNFSNECQEAVKEMAGRRRTGKSTPLFILFTASSVSHESKENQSQKGSECTHIYSTGVLSSSITVGCVSLDEVYPGWFSNSRQTSIKQIVNPCRYANTISSTLIRIG
jgi:hypothetical protein